MPIDRRGFLSGGAAAIIAGVAPRAAWSQTTADVIIIGAGLAGLHAAWMCEQAGLRVILLEGSHRIGGRLHTLDDLPGRPEAGGVQVGSGYARLMAHAERLGIALIEGGEEPREAFYHINGVSSAADQWPASAGNRLSEAERSVVPAALGGLYARRLPTLASTEAWRDPDNLALLDRPYAGMLRGFGASDEALRLLEANSGIDSLHTLSAMHIARSAAIFRSQPGRVRTIAGGSQRLPEAMAAALHSNVRLNSPVRGVRAEPGGVDVMVSGGARLSARKVIVTVPFSVCRAMGIRFTGEPMGAMRQLITHLPQQWASFLYLRTREPFWQADGAPATMWSDHPLIGRVFALDGDPPILKVWLAGRHAGLADLMSEQRRAALIIAAIEQARPAARGQLTPIRYWSWQHQPFARGIYHYMPAGQARTLAEATAGQDGARLHFAGEHLAIAASGMEGALESGEQAARQVISAS